MQALGQDVVVVVSGMDDSGHFVDVASEGEQAMLRLHGNAIHLFSAETGENLEFSAKKETFSHEQVAESVLSQETVTPSVPDEKAADETPPAPTTEKKAFHLLRKKK